MYGGFPPPKIPTTSILDFQISAICGPNCMILSRIDSVVVPDVWCAGPRHIFNLAVVIGGGFPTGGICPWFTIIEWAGGFGPPTAGVRSTP